MFIPPAPFIGGKFVTASKPPLLWPFVAAVFMVIAIALAGCGIWLAFMRHEGAGLG